MSMGSSSDVAGLRNALAMGAAKAVIVSDESLRGTDALGTAKVLAEVIKRESPDLILCDRSHRTATPVRRPCNSPNCSVCPRSLSPSR